MSYKSLREIVRTLAENLRPPERMTVAKAAEKYRFINQPGAYVGQWDNSTAPYMVEPMNTFASRDYSNMAFAGPAQSGKPIWVETPVATPSGWTTMGEIEPGDVIFSEKGVPTTVTYVTPVFQDRECYRIEFDDGSEIIADGVHRWEVHCTTEDGLARAVVTTDEIFQSQNHKDYLIRTTEPLVLPPSPIEATVAVAHAVRTGAPLPMMLLRGAIEQRREAFEVLSEGREGIIEVKASTRAQALSFQELAVSLGYRAKTKGTRVEVDTIPWPWRTITKVVEVHSVPVRCISVSNESHLFLVGEQMVPTHNTDAIVINGLAYSVKVDPMDTMLFCPTNSAARDFSIRRVDRLHRHSPEIGAMLLKGRDADNVMDKHYVTGMIFTISWPSVTELAGRPVGRIIMTDFDRMPIDVGGDGNAFDLATKRTTTFGTFAMCAAESSPSHPILDHKWIPRSPHEAPPCTGIMALYNRGDRRRWQWPCLHCWTWFEGKFDLLVWDDKPESNLEKASTAHMACPHCGTMIHPDERHEMQQWGMWVPEGMHVNNKGQLAGKRPRTTFASYWLRGTAAAFVTWPKLVLTYLDAHDEHERTGSEESLKKFWNNDMGEPYVPKITDSIRLPEAMKSRAEELPEQMVPEGVRFIVANVDVQKNAFVVQVHGILPGRPHDVVVIDRFNISKSKRVDEDGDPELVKPNAYLDDWQLLKEQVMDKEYELGDGSGRMMKVKFTTCDSGGQVGVTDRAYDFYRWLRERGENGRFILVKGDRNPSAPRTRISYPDSQKKDNKSAARGDIPLLMFNPNMLKDALNGRLDVIEPGRGMFHYPKWLPDSWYAEMCAEVRTEKGWENPQKLRNEAWDLSYYCLGVCISPKLLNVEMIDWENPPAWADVWDKNALVRSREDPTRFMAQPKTIDFGKFAEALA